MAFKVFYSLLQGVLSISVTGVLRSPTINVFLSVCLFILVKRDCGQFSTDVLATLILLLLVLLNSAVSLDVRPTPSVPALTSRAGASLSFVFLMLPAASHPACAPGAPSLSLYPVSTLEFQSP